MEDFALQFIISRDCVWRELVLANFLATCVRIDEIIFVLLFFSL